MGMFDSFHVAESLIEGIIKDCGLKLEPFKGYYSFQTKDLDNCLTNFYLHSDGALTWEQQDIDFNNECKNSKWFFNLIKPVGEPQMIPDVRTKYIEFYGLYSTDTERVFAKFVAHIKQGKLAEPISLKIERTDLKQEWLKQQIHREYCDRIMTSWEWCVADAINSICNKARSILRSFEKLEQAFRDKAKKIT